MTQSKTGPKNQTVLQRRHTDGQPTHEKMLNITHYQRNANQNNSEVPFHASQKGCYPKSISNKYWRGCGEKGTLTPLVGMQTSTTTMENSVEIP